MCLGGGSPCLGAEDIGVGSWELNNFSYYRNTAYSTSGLSSWTAVGHSRVLSVCGNCAFLAALLGSRTVPQSHGEI
jgi:hypothetical protein